MILKGSQRGGARQLANHLLNDTKDDHNDHVEVAELRGFVSDDLFGAMAEVQAIAKGTRCKQPVFSLSLNPPKNAVVSREDLFAAADRAGEALSLSDQPRAVVFHEKNGRLHAHVAWSRIDAEQMKAINLPFFKNRLNELSKELYLEHGWELPDGYKENGWKNPLNFSLAEWQQAKRLGLDPREIKQIFASAWKQSDNLASFKQALEEHGYFLAKGDRRSVVALDVQGEVFSVARSAGVTTKDMAQRLKGFEALPAVGELQTDLKKTIAKQARKAFEQDKAASIAAMKPLTDELRRMVKFQRDERMRQDKGQAERLHTENKERAARLRTGLGKVMDVLTGRLFKVRRENEREAYQGYLRDRDQRETLFAAQMKDRKDLQKRLDAQKSIQRQQRMRLGRRLVHVLRPGRAQLREQKSPERSRERSHGLELSKSRKGSTP